MNLQQPRKSNSSSQTRVSHKAHLSIYGSPPLDFVTIIRPVFPEKTVSTVLDVSKIESSE